MSDPWAVQDERNQTSQFVQTRMEFKEIPTIRKDGKPGSYNEVRVFLVPIEPEKQIKEYNTRDFVFDWQKISLPSILRLVALKKLASPSEMQNEQFCVIRWDEYKDRDSYRIAKKKSDGYGKYVKTDEHGEHVHYLGVNWLDVFATEQEWRQAYEAKSNQQIELPIENDKPNDPALEAAKAAIPQLVQAVGTDMTALQQSLNHPPFNAFSLHDDFVKREVAKLVAARADTSAEAQEKMLAEINSHFNGDTPYLEIDSPELTDQLSEIAF